MNDEKFELTICDLARSGTYYADIADELRARDTAQREAIERLHGELDEYISSVPGIENERDNLRERLAGTEQIRDSAIANHFNEMRVTRDLQTQLAEAVGLLRQVDSGEPLIDCETKKALEAFLARHAQAEQQEAHGAQAGMELVGYANFDQLDNMLDDRTATLHPKKTGFAGTPVYRALATQPAVDDLKRLSVTNILLNVVPGPDGMGHEVYAESVEQVERRICDLGDQVEYLSDSLALTSAALAKTAAPPAAAHGDEAVRKRMRQLEVLLDRCRDHVSESMELMADYDDAEEDAGIAQELLDDIDAAMRAQAGEGEDHA